MAKYKIGDGLQVGDSGTYNWTTVFSTNYSVESTSQNWKSGGDADYNVQDIAHTVINSTASVNMGIIAETSEGSEDGYLWISGSSGDFWGNTRTAPRVEIDFSNLITPQFGDIIELGVWHNSPRFTGSFNPSLCIYGYVGSATTSGSDEQLAVLRQAYTGSYDWGAYDYPRANSLARLTSQDLQQSADPATSPWFLRYLPGFALSRNGGETWDTATEQVNLIPDIPTKIGIAVRSTSSLDFRVNKIRVRVGKLF